MAKAKGEITETAVEGAAADLPPESSEAQVAASAAATDAAEAGEAPASNDGAKSSFNIKWVPVAISAAVAVGGGVMAAVFNSKAKSERDKKPKTAEEYGKICDNIDNAQTMRAVGLGIMGLGIVGIGVSFLF